MLPLLTKDDTMIPLETIGRGDKRSYKHCKKDHHREKSSFADRNHCNESIYPAVQYPRMREMLKPKMYWFCGFQSAYLVNLASIQYIVYMRVRAVPLAMYSI